MTESEIRETLDTYRRALRDLQSAIKTVRELELRSTATGSLRPKEVDVLQSLPLSARFEDTVADKIDLETVITAEMINLERMRSEAMRLIDLIQNTKYKIIMIEYYINGSTNSDIAKRLHYETKSINRMKRKAIKQICSKMSL